jgi:LPPG:FO 2-phospho-L-lactate transferase
MSKQNQPISPIPFLNPVVALAGGVGGARLSDGLARNLALQDLAVIVNTGDDFDHLGLRICPDLDTVCYTLAGLANPATGWGRTDDTFKALETLSQLGGPGWFRLGDRDLGLHLERTRRLKAGQSLSEVTRAICKSWEIHIRVLPVTDDSVPTWVYTDEGDLPFQEYFVHRQCRPRVTGFHFSGADQASPAPGVLEAIHQAQAILLCPSNPWVSLDPILAVPGVRQALKANAQDQHCPVVGVSPILGGKTVKGPAAKMYAELGIEPSAVAVARHYAGLLDGFVIDRQDAQLAGEIEALGMQVLVTQTLMLTPDDRRRLAAEVLEFAARLARAAPQEPSS